MLSHCFLLGLVFWSCNGIVLGVDNKDSNSTCSSRPDTCDESPFIQTKQKIGETKEPSDDGWSHWGSDNFRGFKLGPIFCKETPTIGFEQQRRYGLVDAKLKCNDGTTRRSTGNSNGWSNPWMPCNTQGMSGIRVNYQSGYGLVNAECWPDTECPPTLLRSNANTNGIWKRWLLCPPGSKIDGMQVYEQGGYGLVNLRIHCTSKGTPIASDDVSAASDDVSAASTACKWDESLNTVLHETPLLITNLPIQTNEPFDDYSYFLESNGKAHNPPWNFFHTLTFVDGRVRMRQFEAGEALTKLSAVFNESGKTGILFVIHGWNSEPRNTLCNAKRITDRTDYLAIPLIWHTYRGILYAGDYRYDRVHTAPAAGMLLKGLYSSFFHKIRGPKDFMCHSLGCFVTQFFASDVFADGDFDDASSGTKFDNLFLVAPDVRLDIFNEYPYGSGKDKNECFSNQWNTSDLSRRIPDCRPGGGDALVGMVSKKVHVHWNPHDEGGSARSWRLSADLLHTWPLSMYGLLDHGPCMGRDTNPLPKFENKTVFIQWDGLEPKREEHSYQVFDQMLDYYNQVLNEW